MLDVIGYVTAVAILCGYAWQVSTKDQDGRYFHWANALGAPILVTTTVLTVGWTPALVLTVSFGMLGLVGVWRLRHAG